VGFVILGFFGPGLWTVSREIVNIAFTAGDSTSLDDTLMVGGAISLKAARELAFIVLILLIASVVVLLFQVGWLFTWNPIAPSLSRLNPIAGLQRLFSVRSWMATALGLGKLIVVGVVAYVTIANATPQILFAPTIGAPELVQSGGSLAYRLGVRMSAALLVLGLVDWWWQRRRLERDLRMTKEEVKDELRSMEGDPTVKRRQRQVQLQLAVQRLRRDVPKADVVITNPTHFAVAIAYEPRVMFAPKVVAKGADEMAVRIRQLAGEFGVPVVERKSVARALYDAVDVGQYIPDRFYKAVAEILAYVYELTGRSPLSKGAA
jgi:flagellar biosynthetic protein FlhB